MKNTNQEFEGHKTNTAGPVVAGLVLGGLAGAGVALLLAPQSGKETRAQIQQKTMELRDLTAETVDEKIAQVKSKTQQLTADVREKAEELQHRGQDILVKQLDNVSAAAEAGKAAVKAPESKLPESKN
jgi:gas vesicle protein